MADNVKIKIDLDTSQVPRDVEEIQRRHIGPGAQKVEQLRVRVKKIDEDAKRIDQIATRLQRTMTKRLGRFVLAEVGSQLFSASGVTNSWQGQFATDTLQNFAQGAQAGPAGIAVAAVSFLVKSFAEFREQWNNSWKEARDRIQKLNEAVDRNIRDQRELRDKLIREEAERRADQERIERDLDAQAREYAYEVLQKIR